MLEKIQKIREEIASSHTDKAIVLLEELLNALNEKELHEELIILSAQYNKYKREKRINILSFEDEQIIINRVHNSINEIVRALEDGRNTTIFDTSNLKGNYTPPANREIEKFRTHLFEEIRILDIESNWNPKTFTPLDVKVLLESRDGNSTRAADLMKLLLKDKKTKAFLIIGDPGSGKSVALRKLCRNLLAKKSRDLIPLYINLREWNTSYQNRKNIVNLYDFIVSYISDSNSSFVKNFTRKHFSMKKAGYYFFLIHSMRFRKF